MDTQATATIGHGDTQYTLRDLQALGAARFVATIDGRQVWVRVTEIFFVDSIWQARLTILAPFTPSKDTHGRRATA